MSREFDMPSLGADMESAVLVEWRVKPGDAVRRGDVVAVVETDKGAIDIEIYETGTVERLLVEPGTRVPVGGVLALIAGAAAAEPPAAPLRPGEGKKAPGTSEPVPAAPAVTPSAAAAGRARVSPAARARARELGVAIDALHGSGPDGAITLQDVEAAAKPAATTAETMRAVIAAAMAKSKREIPHYYLSTEVDYAATMHWLGQRNAQLSIEQRMLPVVPLLRAIVLALGAFPDFNGYYRDGAYQPGGAIHLGVAIAQRGGGLIAPALLDAQAQSLAQLTQNLGDLVSRVRTGRLKNRELSEGTVTLTSLGDGGVDAVFPVIYPPQVAIIGAGSVRERPCVVAGRVEVRPVMTLSLAADHRVSNGREGAQFLARIGALLQSPEQL